MAATLKHKAPPPPPKPAGPRAKLEIAFGPQPAHGPVGLGEGHYWTSQCGKYRVARLLDVFGIEPRFVAMAGNYLIHPKSDYRLHGYQTLGQALRACAAYHATQTGSDVRVNDDAVVAEAAGMGLATLPTMNGTPKAREEKRIVKVTQAKVHQMFEVMGFKSMDKWALSDYQRKLASLVTGAIPHPELREQVEDDPEALVTLETILSAVNKKEDVVIAAGKDEAAEDEDELPPALAKAAKKAKAKADAAAQADAEAEAEEEEEEETEEEEEAEEEADGEEEDAGEAEEAEAEEEAEGEDDEAEATPPKQGKKKGAAPVATATAVRGKKAKAKEAKGKAAASAPKRASSSGEGKDKYGSRIGTKAAEINKILSKKAKTVAEIREEAGVEPPIQGHLTALTKKGILVKNKEGKYALK